MIIFSLFISCLVITNTIFCVQNTQEEKRTKALEQIKEFVKQDLPFAKHALCINHELSEEAALEKALDIKRKSEYGNFSVLHQLAWFNPLFSQNTTDFDKARSEQMQKVIIITKAFIDAGADVNALDSLGRTPSDSAYQRPHPELATLFAEHGGKIKRNGLYYTLNEFKETEEKLKKLNHHVTCVWPTNKCSCGSINNN